MKSTKTKKQQPVPTLDSDSDSSTDDADVFTRKLKQPIHCSTTPYRSISQSSNNNNKSQTNNISYKSDIQSSDVRTTFLNKVQLNHNRGRPGVSQCSSSDEDDHNQPIHPIKQSTLNTNNNSHKDIKSVKLGRLQALRNKQCVVGNDSSSDDDCNYSTLPPNKLINKSMANSIHNKNNKLKLVTQNKIMQESKRIDTSDDDDSSDGDDEPPIRSLSLPPKRKPITQQPITTSNNHISSKSTTVQHKSASVESSSDDESIQSAGKQPITNPSNAISSSSDDDRTHTNRTTVRSPGTKAIRKPNTVIQRHNHNDHNKSNGAVARTSTSMKSSGGLTNVLNKLRTGVSNMVKLPFGDSTDTDEDENTPHQVRQNNKRGSTTVSSTPSSIPDYTLSVTDPTQSHHQQQQQRLHQLYHQKSYQSIDPRLTELDSELNGTNKIRYGIPGNKLLYHNTLYRRSNTKSIFGSYQLLPRSLYLLNNKILICTVQSKHRIQLKTQIELNSCCIDSQCHMTQFTLIDQSTQRSYIFQCNSTTDKQQWCTAIHQSISQTIYSMDHTVVNTPYWYQQYCINTLHYAVHTNNTALVKQLLTLDTQLIHSTDIEGNTALHIAIYHNNTELVTLLLQYNADQSITNLHNYNAIQHCCIHGYHTILSLLLDSSNALQPISWHNSASTDLTDTSAIWLCMLYHNNSYADCVALLLSKVPDRRLYDCDRTGYTIAEYCIHLSYSDCINVLYSNQYDFNLLNKYGLTVLMQCSMTGNISMLSTLIQLGTQLNTVDQHGNTALHYASSIEIASYLVAAGARVNLKNQHGVRSGELYESTTLQHCIELYEKRRSCESMNTIRSQAQSIQENHNHPFDSCAICNTEYTVLYKPTYCRSCRWIVCRECTTKKCYFIPDDQFGRVCDGCYNLLSTQQHSSNHRSMSNDKSQSNVLDSVTSFLTSVKISVPPSHTPQSQLNTIPSVSTHTTINNKLQLPAQQHRKQQPSVSTWSPAPVPTTNNHKTELPHQSDTVAVNESNHNMFNLMRDGLNKIASTTQKHVINAANHIESNVMKGVHVVHNQLRHTHQSMSNDRPADDEDDSEAEREENEWNERKKYLNPREIAREERQRHKVRLMKLQSRQQQADSKPPVDTSKNTKHQLLSNNTSVPQSVTSTSARINNTLQASKQQAQHNVQRMAEIADHGEQMTNDANDFAAMAAKLKHKSKSMKK